MKIKRGFIVMLALCLAMILGTAAVNAGTITSLNAQNQNGKISVSGQVSPGVLACAVNIYDEQGNTLKAMETCQVTSDNTYSHIMSNKLPAGKYLVTVADYDGGTAVSQIVQIAGASEGGKSAKTGDDRSIMFPVILALLALMGMGAVPVIKRRVG